MRRVRLLVELSERGTIAAVAEAMHTSASGVSQQLSLLEREVGTPLLQRVGRGVTLTEAGRRLAVRGAEVIAALEEAQAEARSADQDPAGTVRLAAFSSAALALIPPLLACQAAHPRLRVELVAAEPEVALPALLSGAFDIIVSEEYPGVPPQTHPRLHREVLTVDPLELVVARDLLGGREVAACCAEEPWALELEASSSRTWAEQYCRGLGFEPDVQFESCDLSVLLELIRRGAAVGLMPALALPAAGREAGLVRQPTGTARTIVTLVRSGREHDPSLHALRELLHTGRPADPEPIRHS